MCLTETATFGARCEKTPQNHRTKRSFELEEEEEEEWNRTRLLGRVEEWLWQIVCQEIDSRG